MSDNNVDFERFTAAGRPFGTAPTMSVGGSGSAAAAVGGGMFGAPSLLPHRFKDNSIILVPIRISDLQDPDEDFEAWWASIKAESGQRRRSLGFFLRGVFKRSPVGASKGDFVTLKMTRADYLRYCAKDEKGAYVGSEPQSTSRTVLKEMVARQHGQRQMSVPDAAYNPVQNVTTYEVGKHRNSYYA